MTITLYQTDSYIRTFEALVTAFDEHNHGVILDRSAFYPGGGGQPADKGLLENEHSTWTVQSVKKISSQIIHLIDKGQALPAVGSAVTGFIDWDHRYALMRTHTAMHILCGVVFRDYGASVTGGNMDPLKGRMDFEFESMAAELVAEIEAAINVEVEKNRPIAVQILPRDQAFEIPDLIRTKINLLPEGITEVRTVEIVGLDLQADGGTHVRSTAEVGRLKVTDYKSKGRINKRIYVELVDQDKRS